MHSVIQFGQPLTPSILDPFFLILVNRSQLNRKKVAEEATVCELRAKKETDVYENWEWSKINLFKI